MTSSSSSSTTSTTKYFASFKDAASSPTLFSPKIAIHWPSVPMGAVIPHRFRRKIRSTLRSGSSPASSLAQLQTSIDPADTLKALRSHQWSFYDAQYLIIIVVGLFCFSVIEVPGPLLKTLIATLLLSSLTIPLTRQFFLPLLPVLTYLILFYSCKFIPAEWRPHIWVRVLPALENIVYGANLSNILSKHQNAFLDILAWIPYGILHFTTPFITAAVMFIFGGPGSLPVYSRTFGYMNALGVATQLVFPNAPPWYENKYGLAPANYGIQGSPAGLERVDKLFGVDLYTSTFTASPMVFGAFPSLHAAVATMNALFLGHIFPRGKPVFIAWIVWIWWATLYLSHHYAVDLIAGSVLSAVFFYIAKAKFLPRVQMDKRWRWDYDYVEIGESESEYSYLLSSLDTSGQKYHSDSDEWTVGGMSNSGSLSPASESQSLWEGETLADRESDFELR
ncbi:Aureobasidin resistance protein Aur1 [Orbilia oligospora]|uniref:Aureobasidin resistance protein Aur1 n=1 Tax=Orbilia oligospora TaxID=2813651 RepID=A0A7C8NJM1_ORBOL|nr:Aureobasidin resistance protein Aur1 [Orbilia oligospora]KAF3109645.1 Aureobasidin resistance protein Aur1 [Orbilia oligospora]KAF3114953.1 Aureobasidin resistance protein Aur1 [Orbilia oligospora]KAF3121798.1 Aureobasidin resistance protein Aur1 [Orbilia oligospora]KAF3121955.1 Aureobasidin resistance protein Aur1 [Orbilia oligospora]